MAANSLSTYEGQRTPALHLLLAFRAIGQKADRLYLLLGYICGLELLLLGFFITYQVVARNLDWPRAPGTDVISGYVLAMAVTWALAYSLRSDSHVRIDVLLPRMSPPVRAVADLVALGGLAFLGYVTAWEMWESVISDYQRDVYNNVYPRTPLFIPKAVVAVGFTMLVITALQMMLSMIAERLLPRLHELMGGQKVE
ncbi:MAG: TRAP transporter small permease [Dehalococcoidia bacterium]|nr:TRAP transporter small permease [Dehalococcoidia bacterium]